MDERKQRILRAIIEDYVKSAEPVGSRTIAKNYNLGISPATVRNEMADLEDLGYLAKPHTSARSEEHTSELQSRIRISYAVFCLKKSIDRKSVV